jgi:hypothetical protein
VVRMSARCLAFAALFSAPFWLAVAVVVWWLA